MPVLNPDALIDERVAAIRKLHTATGQTRAEIDVSGGVDSAVLVMLLARALQPENVTAIFLGINSTDDARNRAREVCAAAGVKFIDFDGTALLNTMIQTMYKAMDKAGFSLDEIYARAHADPTIMGSIRSTLRAPWGRAANRLTGGGIRHGTGNEDEDRVMRFYQKGGDGEVDTNPISMLSKGEVFQLARALGVPRSILTARPSPDLWGVGEAHNDEDEIAAYLRLTGKGQTFYSYVDPDTGEYKNVGLIERLHRYLDLHWAADGWTIADSLFASEFDAIDFEEVLEEATEIDIFKGIPEDVVRTLLTSARRVEAATRHKMNPNCPALGDRQSLLNAGILTNNLPV